MMDENLEESLKKLVEGQRQPINGMEIHFLKVLAGTSTPCTKQEREWLAWANDHQSQIKTGVTKNNNSKPLIKTTESSDRSIYIRCESCGMEESSFLMLKDANLILEKGNPSIKYVNHCLPKIECSICHSKNLSIFIKERKTQGGYVATVNSNGMVFHKSKCGWLVHVPLESAIIFNSRQEAIKLGFRPCSSCKP